MLGPTLFTIYINDIDENIKSQILKFADDTKIMAPHLIQENVKFTLWSCKPKTRVYNGSTEDCALDRRKRSRGSISNQPVTQPKSSHSDMS